MTRPHFQFWPRRLPHNISSPQTSLWYNLEVSARRYPDKDAIIFYGRHTTFRELHDDAVAVAGWLQQVAGVQKGDRRRRSRIVIVSYRATFFPTITD